LIEPLEISFDVECSVEHAFDTWTSRIEAWWPKEHTVSAERDVSVILEPRRGGRLYERTADGSEHEWGEITTWEPPTKFGYLWHIRRDRSDATDVEISFSALDASKTRVDIMHTGWDRLGDDGQRWRDRNTTGWNGVIPDYLREAEKG
jgi:Activator of Hsp90 ATPase homolog 1-like protein